MELPKMTQLLHLEGFQTPEIWEKIVLEGYFFGGKNNTMQIRELSCKTLQIPIKTIKPQKTGKQSKKKTGKNSQKKMQPDCF